MLADHEMLVKLAAHLDPPRPPSATANALYGRRYRKRHGDRARTDAARRQ